MGIASILIQSEDVGLAQALGHVIGAAVQHVGFTDVNVQHYDDLEDSSEGVPQTDFEGPSLLQALKAGNPDLFESRIDITSCVAEAWVNDFESAEESEDEVVDEVAAAHLAEIVQDIDS
jgi:hypothetical protein